MYKLQPEETIADAAWHMLGDRRLTNEIVLMDGKAYLRDERPGRVARWAADPTTLSTPQRR
jgi:hypothetical protein